MNTLQCKQIIHGTPPVLNKEDVIALDLELSGLREEQLHRPAGRMVSLAGCFDGETVYIIQDEEQVPEFLENIKEAMWIFHNSTFDIGHLRRWAEVKERPIRDTMLIEKLMYSDYYSDFGLNDLVRRHLKCYMDKAVREEFNEQAGAMTREQVEYAALDVIGTFLVDRAQQAIIGTASKRVWDKIDMPTVWTSVDLSVFVLDKSKWLAVYERHEGEVERIEEELGTKYGTTVRKEKGRGKNKVWADEFILFNPASPSQVLSNLRNRGLEVDSTGDDILNGMLLSADCSAPDREFIEQIIQYRGAAKKASTYGKEYLKFVEADGRIYSSLNVLGASTGRLSSRSPNLQQIPRGHEYRECFIASKGSKLIIADYSSQEPRIFAALCGDENLINIFKSGKDIYCEVAREAFDEEITKADKERRTQIKALVLGLIYGLSPYGFARDNEVDQETAEDMFSRFFAAFPKAAQWVKERQQINTGFTKTILGRRCHLHPYNAQWKRNALNNPIQGTGSDMLKLAMREFRAIHKNDLEQGLVRIVLPVHDEIILECLEELADDMKAALENVMISVAEKIHVGIPASVEAHVADSWADK